MRLVQREVGGRHVSLAGPERGKRGALRARLAAAPAGVKHPRLCPRSNSRRWSRSAPTSSGRHAPPPPSRLSGSPLLSLSFLPAWNRNETHPAAEHNGLPSPRHQGAVTGLPRAGGGRPRGLLGETAHSTPGHPSMLTEGQYLPRGDPESASVCHVACRGEGSSQRARGLPAGLSLPGPKHPSSCPVLWACHNGPCQASQSSPLGQWASQGLRGTLSGGTNFVMGPFPKSSGHQPFLCPDPSK